jgi:hypothetical protein
LAAAGVLAYAALSVAYDRFYRLLGASPRDVGLSYTNILSHSLGLAILLASFALFFALFFALLFTALSPVLNNAVRIAVFAGNKESNPPNESAPQRWTRIASYWTLIWTRIAPYWTLIWTRIASYWRSYRTAIALFLALAIAYSATAQLLYDEAQQAATAVREGKAISSVTLGPVVALDIRADPVQVEWFQPDSHIRPTQILFFLGEGANFVLLYDHVRNEAIRVQPSSIKSMRAINCEARQAEDVCK